MQLQLTQQATYFSNTITIGALSSRWPQRFIYSHVSFGSFLQAQNLLFRLKPKKKKLCCDPPEFHILTPFPDHHYFSLNVMQEILQNTPYCTVSLPVSKKLQTLLQINNKAQLLHLPNIIISVPADKQFLSILEAANPSTPFCFQSVQMFASFHTPQLHR